MPEPSDNYSESRGMVSKAYANAPRKAARSAETADDGARTAQNARITKTNKSLVTTRSSGKVIEPTEGSKSGMVINPSVNKMKKSLQNYMRDRRGTEV